VEPLDRIQGAKVLLAEDNEINQQVAREILENAGLVVAIANNGKEAVEMVKAGVYDAVLMDIQMPEMNGFEATREIRKWEAEMRGQKTEGGGQRVKDKGQRKEGKEQSTEGRGQITDDKEDKIEYRHQTFSLEPLAFSLPIIAMTAHAMAGDREKSLEAGMTEHVTKPIDPDELFATLLKCIRPSEKRRPSPQPEVSAERPESDQAVQGEEQLPDLLPGFDLEAGLRRLGGNKSLYKKLLLDFGTNYRGIAAEISEALEAKDFEQAHSLVHDLKGLAGNLEAGELQTAAVKMEGLVKNQSEETVSQEGLEETFAELENALGQALDAVRALGSPAGKKAIEPSGNGIAAIPAELIQDVPQRIRDGAELGDVKALIDIARELDDRSDSCAPLSERLVQLAEDFDFEGILKLASELTG
jgi:CheY-like chemotaxis protein